MSILFAGVSFPSATNETTILFSWAIENTEFKKWVLPSPYFPLITILFETPLADSVIKAVALSIISFLGVFIVLIITLYNNITLNNKNKELQGYLDEYKELREEIDKLNNLKENYDIVKLNNNNLTNQKKELETRINELNNEIKNLNKKIDKLK